MLTLNSQSWFARKFLQIKFEHERPTNICSFIRRLLVATVVWALVGFMASLLVASYITTIYGLVVVLFTNTTFHDFFARGSYGGWPNLALAMCSTSMLILTVVGSLSAFFWIKEKYKHKSYHDAQKEYYATHQTFNGFVYTPPKQPIRDTVRAIWARIHDKTCTFIEWK